MKISSSAFRDEHTVSLAYSQNRHTRPPLTITELPEACRSLTVMVYDWDGGVRTVHWVLFNVEPNIGVLLDNETPEGALRGRNDSGGLDFVGPNQDSGTHRYVFHVYALREKLPLIEGAPPEAVEIAMRGLVLDEAKLVGVYDTAIYYA